MAIGDYEGSRDLGQPVELYQFVYGEAGQSYAYTNAEEEITHDTVVYEVESVERSEIESDGKLSGKEVQIKVPITADVAELFRVFPPGRVVNVVIRQGHVADPDAEYPVVWVGRVLEAQREDNVCALTCEALSAGMKRPGLRRHYQWPCPLVLYGPRCQALKVPIPATVSSITGNKITLSGGWIGAFVPANFIGGLFEWAGTSGTEARGILRIEDTNTVVISGPPIGLEASDSVSVYLGCPHTLAGCAELHDNVQNYGGQPWIPSGDNPVGRNNHT